MTFEQGHNTIDVRTERESIRECYTPFTTISRTRSIPVVMTGVGEVPVLGFRGQSSNGS